MKEQLSKKPSADSDLSQMEMELNFGHIFWSPINSDNVRELAMCIYENLLI